MVPNWNHVLQGVGTEADEKEAEKYLRKSADYGNTHAAYQLAKLYIRQKTEKRKTNPEEIPDYEKIRQAFKWLTEASEQGNSFADYALGKLYADGELTAKNMEKAFYHYTEQQMQIMSMRGTSWADCICRMSIRTSAGQSII